MQFKTPNNEAELDVNLTPLIDVVFLLLIFFMVSTTFDTTSQLKIDLPEADIEKTAIELQKLEISINAKGYFFINGKQLASKNRSALLAALNRHVVDSSDELSVIIQSDASTPVQSLVTAMDVVGRLGLSNLSIVTTQVNVQ